MRRVLILTLVVALVFSFVCPLRAPAAVPGTTSATKSPPGVELAQAISMVTGVAISPLLGVGAVGAWKYCEANTPVLRAQLPWFAQPWFFVPALMIVAICALKDVFGMTIPVIVKKPFDVLETVQHKVSALIAVGAFVPLVASVFSSVGATQPPGLNLASSHGFLAVVNGAWLYNTLTTIFLMGAFCVVFLASNAINILILLSPFPLVDTMLKAFRLLVLATVVGTALVNPWFGAFWSLCLIFVAYFIAGWSLRLTHFGTIFIWDFTTFRSRRFRPEKSGNWMFLSRKINRVPVRTYGKFSREADETFVFHYHPWLIFPAKTLVLPTGTYAVGKGMFTSEISCANAGVSRGVMLLPPRYRSHEQELAEAYELTDVRNAGLRAVFAWISERIGFATKPKLITA